MVHLSKDQFIQEQILHFPGIKIRKGNYALNYKKKLKTSNTSWLFIDRFGEYVLEINCYSLSISNNWDGYFLTIKYVQTCYYSLLTVLFIENNVFIYTLFCLVNY